MRSVSVYAVVSSPATSKYGPAFWISLAKSAGGSLDQANTTGSSSVLDFENSGNQTIIATLSANSTASTHLIIRLNNVPIGSEILVANHTYYYPVYVSSYPSAGNVTIVARILAGTQVGVASWQGYVGYFGFENSGLSDTRALTGDFVIAFSLVAAVLLWGVFVSAFDRSVLRWFPFATLVILGLSLFIYAFIGSSQELLVPGWHSWWSYIILPLSHQGYSHLTGNIPGFIAASTVTELLVRRLHKRLFVLAYLIPLVLDYSFSLVLQDYGISVLLGGLALSGLVVLMVYRDRIKDILGPATIALAAVAYGFALTSVFFNYIIQMTLNRPFQDTFGTSESFGHLFFISVIGLIVLACLAIGKTWAWPEAMRTDCARQGTPSLAGACPNCGTTKVSPRHGDSFEFGHGQADRGENGLTVEVRKASAQTPAHAHA